MQQDSVHAVSQINDCNAIVKSLTLENANIKNQIASIKSQNLNMRDGPATGEQKLYFPLISRKFLHYYINNKIPLLQVYFKAQYHHPHSCKSHSNNN